MDSVKMNRVQLLEIVRGNKDKHVAEYREAVEDYMKLALKTAQENLTVVMVGNFDEIKNLKPAPPAPVSYEDSYRRAIRMLELSVEDVIDIEQQVFNQLVLDEWTWKHAFSTSNAMYKAAY